MSWTVALPTSSLSSIGWRGCGSRVNEVLDETWDDLCDSHDASKGRVNDVGPFREWSWTIGGSSLRLLVSEFVRLIRSGIFS